MNLLIRADGSPKIGVGHLVRCLALAEEWQAQSGRVSLAYTSLPDSLRASMSAAGVECLSVRSERGSSGDAAETKALADASGANWVALDGYAFDDSFEEAVKSGGRRLLALDDFGHASHRAADLVLNQNLYATRSTYSACEPHTRLLLGSSYVLLRNQFRRWRDWQRDTPAVASKLLITLGGGSTALAAVNVLAALSSSKASGHYDVLVLAGGEAQGPLQRDSFGGPYPFSLRVETHKDDISEVMAWADMSISAGGSTCWELAFMGVPNCILSLTDHQNAVAKALADGGAAISLGSGHEIESKAASCVTKLALDPERRRAMTETARRLVDGRGAERVVRAMRGEELELRPPTFDDRELLWNWRNDDDARAQSFSTAVVTWEDHVRWFEKTLADPQSQIWVCTDPTGTPIGQGRFSINGRDAKISVSVDRAWRGRGYGAILIDQLTQRLFSERGDVTTVHAWIKQDNEASRRAFEKAGYRFVRPETVEGGPAWLYTSVRESRPIAPADSAGREG